MLEGYDDKWLNANDKRTVSYNDVPAGEYTFRVKAFLLENPNKYDERKINIIVPPYAFASNTALWVYLIIIIGGILGGLLWRKKVKINALNRMRVLKVGPEESVGGYKIISLKVKPIIASTYNTLDTTDISAFTTAINGAGSYNIKTIYEKTIHFPGTTKNKSIDYKVEVTRSSTINKTSSPYNIESDSIENITVELQQ
jgi:hypothetical protein